MARPLRRGWRVPAGYTLEEASELTGLPIEELPHGPARYTELGFGEPHERILPYGLKGLGKVSHDHAKKETKIELGIPRLIEYLQDHSSPTDAVDENELIDASGLWRQAVEPALAALRVVGLVQKYAAPKHSGKKTLWSWVGEERTNAPVGRQEAA